MKKLMSFFIAIFVFMMTFSTVPAAIPIPAAYNLPELTIGSASGKPGEMVCVPLSINNNTGCSAMLIQLNMNSDLTLSERYTRFGGGWTGMCNASNNYIVASNADGVYGEVTFDLYITLPQTCKETEYKIGAEVLEFYDAEFSEVIGAVINPGKIIVYEDMTISAEEPFETPYVTVPPTETPYPETLTAPEIVWWQEDDCLQVEMYSEDGADIYYTTDGSTPTENSSKYTHMLTFYTDTEMKAVAVRDGCISSDVTTENAVLEDERDATPVPDATSAPEDEETEDEDEDDYEDYEDYEDYDDTEDSYVNPAYIVSPWAEDEVDRAYEYGLIPDEMLSENLTRYISREKFSAIAVKLYEALTGDTAEYGSIHKTPFGDCYNRDSAYEEYITAAYLLGITDGVTDYTFCPNDAISREQLATMLCRVIKKSYIAGWSLKLDFNYIMDTSGVNRFADDSLISDFAKNSVYYMVKHGIIEGMDNHLFTPRNLTEWQEDGTATKEQAIIMALRAYENSDELGYDYEIGANN